MMTMMTTYNREKVPVRGVEGGGEVLGRSREVWLVVSHHRDLKNLTLFMKGDPIL